MPNETSAPITIRQLMPADAEAYRDIRLEALQLHPEAFSSAFETESAEALSWFQDRLAQGVTFGAFAGSALIGTAAFFRQPGPKRAHKGAVVGVYVRASSRRNGVARLLTERIIEHARSSVELLQLSVTKDNEPARRLYAALGFVDYGIEKNALKIGERYYDDILMAKPLC
jgi:ribosomal protein S18 acetylase RimI-like enzyme